jgi:CelD/BcsL family acetyltransferase involved in cellulose biosynthesis
MIEKVADVTRAPMQITHVGNFEAFEALAASCGELFALPGLDNVFLTHAWLAAWWRVYAPGRSLCTLVGMDGHSPVALLPLVLEHGRGGVRRLVFMGSGEVAPDHLDLIARPQDKAPAAEAFCDYLWRDRARWDLLDLVSVAEDSPLRSAVAERLGAHGCDVRVTLYTRCAHASLPGTFEEFVQRLGQTTRGEFRRKRRRLLREVKDVRFGVVKDEVELAEVFEAMVRLHQARWNRQGEAGIFASRAFTEFHRAATRIGLARGALRLYYIRIGPDVGASYYCYRLGERVFYYAGGFDERFRTHSVGIQLLAHAIEQSILEGAKDFDFLQGDEEYKLHWSNGTRDNWRVTVAAPHWRGRLAGWGAGAASRLHGMWRQHVPMTTRRFVKRLLRQGGSNSEAEA